MFARFIFTHRIGARGVGLVFGDKEHDLWAFCPWSEDGDDYNNWWINPLIPERLVENFAIEVAAMFSDASNIHQMLTTS